MVMTMPHPEMKKIVRLLTASTYSAATSETTRFHMFMPLLRLIVLTGSEMPTDSRIGVR